MSTLEHGLKLQNKLDALEKKNKQIGCDSLETKEKTFCLCKKAGAAEHKCKQPSSCCCKKGKLQAGMKQGERGLQGHGAMSGSAWEHGLGCTWGGSGSKKLLKHKVKNKRKPPKGLKVFGQEKRWQRFSQIFSGG